MWNQGMKMLVKKLHKDAVMPSYAHEGDSGLDLYTVEDVTIAANGTGIAPTGLAVALPPYTEMQIRNRSGITIKGCKCYVVKPVIDTVDDNRMKFKEHREESMCYERVMLGTVDGPYRGEIGVMVYNQEKVAVTIPKGTKLAQAVICPIIIVDVEEVDELPETSRGGNGYGSTGI